jgi:flagellar hook assembly protein FlgD
LNPFRTATTFLWLAGVEPIGPRRVTIADVAGRVIRSEAVSGSDGSWTWDGRDERGRGVVSGVYYATLAPSGGPGSTIAVVKVR